MHITIWLSIAVFIATIYCPQLLNFRGAVLCFFLITLFIYRSKYRYLSIMPLTALYFVFFTQVFLFGGNIGQITSHNPNKNNALSSEINKRQFNLILPIFKKQENTITVKIKSLINNNNKGYFVASVLSVNNLSCNFCPMIEMRWYKPTVQVQAGQVHQFNVKVKPLQGRGNPNSFDRQKWRYSQHIAYVASIKDHIGVINDSFSWRASLYLKMLKATAGMSQQGAIMALIFADKSLLSEKAKETIKALGIAHLFAISGLHIGLLFLFSFVIFHFFAKKLLPSDLLGWFSWRMVHIVSFSVCVAYAYISGFSLPTQRALIMLFLGILMLVSKRKISAFDLLIFSLWIILLLDPLAVLSSSLWLSFTAMSAILFFIWTVQKRKVIHLTGHSWWKVQLSKCYSFIKWLLLLQLLLTLFMLPIQLLNFSAISLFSLLINLIAIPLFSWLIIPITLFATILLLFTESVAMYFLSVSNWILDTFINYFENFSVGYVLLSEQTIMGLLTFLMVLVLGLFLAYLKCFHIINKKCLVIVVALFFIFLSVRAIELAWKIKQSWQIAIFDVGQGLSVLITSNGESLLYDTGPSYSGGHSAAEYSVLPYLQAKGIREFEYLFISHSDNDHAGGRYVIDENTVIKNAYAGEAKILNETQVMAQKIKYRQCFTGQNFVLGKLKVSVLSPDKVNKNNNDNSCVLKVSDGVNSLLLTGDISQNIESQLVNKEKAGEHLATLKSDIIIAPHHGSKTSSSMLFIKQVQPTWVVFAAGYGNRWHFPVAQVVERYKTLGVSDLTTGNTGFIRFNVENQHIEVKTYREDLAAYWYHLQIAF